MKLSRREFLHGLAILSLSVLPAPKRVEQWHHAAGAWSSNIRRKVSFNGDRDRLDCELVPPIKTPSSWGACGQGLMIWDRALTEKEVWLLNQGVAGQYVAPDALAFWAPLISGKEVEVSHG